MKKRSISITQQGEYMTETITRGNHTEILITRIDEEPIKVGEMVKVKREPYLTMPARPPFILFPMRVHKYDDSGNKKVSVMSAIDYIFPTDWEFI